MNLIGIRQGIKNSLGGMNGVCDDNDVLDIENINGLTYITSNGE